MTVLTFLSSSFFSMTSSITASVQIWGAGGNGDSNSGGSGAAYVTASVGLSGSAGTPTVYSCSVAQPFTGTGSDFLALSSSLLTGSSGAIILSAIGGSSTGDIAHQLTSGAVSGSGLYFQGGTALIDSFGTENFNGTGGGASGGWFGAGQAGSSAIGLGRTGNGAIAAPGGVGYSTSSNGYSILSGNGGSGSFYDSNRSTVVPALNGAFPGGGGGGTLSYNYSANPYLTNSSPTSLGAPGAIVIQF